MPPQSVNLIVKRRYLSAGLESSARFAHGLRSGFLTEAARQGIPLPEAMRQSQHWSVQQAANYDDDAERGTSRAAKLLGSSQEIGFDADGSLKQGRIGGQETFGE